jgi:intracellular septation protein
MKPTMIYLLFGGVLGAGLLRGQSWLQVVMEGMMPLSDRGWMILTRRLMLFFFALAVLNEAIWRTQSDEVWVYFKTFGLTAAIFIFFMTQGRLFRDHALEEEEEDKP